MIDLRPIEERYTGRQHELRCPHCGDWSRSLLIVASGELFCKSCWRLIERYGVEHHRVEHHESKQVEVQQCQ